MTYEERISHPAPGDFATPEERHRRALGETFERRDDFERILAMQSAAAGGNVVARDELAAILNPSARMSLGHYASARGAAVALGMADPVTGETIAKAPVR